MNEKNLQRSESVKEKILITAECEFAEYGYFGARVDSIEERSGINKRIIYQHFESKSALYSKVLIRVYERLAECERSYIINELPPIDAIRNIINVSFRFLKDDPSFVRMLMWENLNKEGAGNNAALISLKQPSIDYIKRKIESGQADGIFRKDIDFDQVVISITNFCFSYFSSIYTAALYKDEEMSNDAMNTYSSFVSDIIIRYLTN